MTVRVAKTAFTVPLLPSVTLTSLIAMVGGPGDGALKVTSDNVGVVEPSPLSVTWY